MAAQDTDAQARALCIPTHELRRAGHTAFSLRQRVASGSLLRLRQGWYIDPKALEHASDSVKQHAVMLVTHQDASRTPLLSHRSAATVHGFPVWSNWLRTVGGAASQRVDPLTTHQTVPPGHRSSRTAGVRYAHGTVPHADIVELGGFRVTSAERTLIDLARSEPFELALSCADQYLHETVRVGTQVDFESWSEWRAQMLTRITPLAGSRGVGRARALVALADPRADSPLETVSRLRFLQNGIDVEPQHPVRSERGSSYFLDFWLLNQPFFGECDGKVKYTDSRLRGGQSAEQVVYREKLRQDWVTATTGRRGVRWGAAHVGTGALFARRLRAFGVRIPAQTRPTRRFGADAARVLGTLPE
ncbi:hypothetical protein EDF62_2148 [Leucobacter luti]|uniref:Uncharacterized protein n=1 Tax=Leucobacter luti TaxID=340320 RepID=A0A4R6RWV9_9MICO|nr:hypothetical protein [Leucobacter luti]TDP91531.1 hypothetical protein EDF62_2148 [Leucobacter luti]